MPDICAVLEADNETYAGFLAELSQCPRVTGSTESGQLRQRERVQTTLREYYVARETRKLRYLWPVVARVLPDGAHRVQRARDRKHEIEALFARLGWQSARDPVRNQLAASLQHCLGEQMADDAETAVTLRRLLSEQERAALGEQVTRTGRWTPTRAHPDAPATPWIAAVAGPVLAVVDHLRDWLQPGAEGLW